MLCIEDSLDRAIGVYNTQPMVSQHALLEFDKVHLTLFPVSLMAAWVMVLVLYSPIARIKEY